jgi:hypothetical protein
MRDFVKLPPNESVSPPLSALRGRLMRVVLLAYLSAMAIGCILAFYGAIFMRADFLVGAAISGVVVLAARSFLRDRLAASETDIAAFGEDTISSVENECDGRVGELVELLREWDGLERSRGTADFDPWALQSARNEIRLAVQSDPTLERLFRPRD